MPDLLEAMPDAWRLTPHTFAVKASRGKWLLSRHLEYIGRLVTNTIIQGNGRLILNMPVRHGKSFFMSYWLPTWYLSTFPDNRVILAAYGEEIATEWGRRVRNEFASNPMLTNMLREDSKAAGRWNTPQGGGMMVAGVGGALSGFGANLILCDDLIKNWQEAHSYTTTMALRDWWRSTLFTRKEPGATVIVAMTRWTDDDVCAWLQTENPGEWTVIKLPALAGTNDPLGRSEGQPLWPERFDETALMQERRAAGASVWASLYQQNPELGSDRLYRRFAPANEDASIQGRADLPLMTCWDFNILPGNHVEIFQYDRDRDTLLFLDEIYEERLDVRRACEQLLARRQCYRCDTRQPLQIFGDATGGSQWAGSGESCYDIMRLALRTIPHALHIPASNPPVIDRINTVNEALCDVENKIHVKIHPRCVRLLEDLRKMKPDAQGLEDKHDSKLSHSASAAGYAICYLRPLWAKREPIRGRYQ
jgi:hypothetical protein